LKMRIGVVMYQTSSSKGQELVAQRMVAYFRRCGHDAYLIASVFHDGTESITEVSMGEKEYVLTDDKQLEIPIIRVGSFTSRWPPRRVIFKDSIYTLEKIVNEFKLNVLITHSTLWNGPEEVAKFVEWRRNMKALGGYRDVLVFCHMSHFQEPSPHRYSLVERSFRIAWNRLSLRTILHVANLVLVVTPYERDEKVKMHAKREQCYLFPGGVDDYSFANFATTNPQELSEKYHIPPDAKIVTYLGTIEERKNPKAVLEVAEKLLDRPDIHFVIAGREESEYADQARKRAAELRNVTWLGEISAKEKIQLIKLSYLNILLSKMEALGLAQLEFMFQGVPVITSGVGGQSWIIRNDEEGVHVDGPKDVDGAARAVKDLTDDNPKWHKLSAKAKHRATDLALTKLITQLGAAIIDEIEKESGLSKLSNEVRRTLSEPEIVLNSWSHGSRRVVLTSKRLFIQRGRISRSTVELHSSDLKSIEHIRKYPWRLLLVSVIISSLLFTQHYVSPIISGSITSEMFLTLGTIPVLGIELSRILAVLWAFPIIGAFVVFLLQVRKGYALHGATLKPIYLPHSFRDAIAFIRDNQSNNEPVTNQTLYGSNLTFTNEGGVDA